jgi:hypothetical protein
LVRGQGEELLRLVAGDVVHLGTRRVLRHVRTVDLPFHSRSGDLFVPYSWLSLHRV